MSAAKSNTLRRLVRRGWFEEYTCGCVSETVAKRRELLGYCAQHGADRKGVFREVPGCAVQVERKTPNIPLYVKTHSGYMPNIATTPNRRQEQP